MIGLVAGWASAQTQIQLLPSYELQLPAPSMQACIDLLSWQVLMPCTVCRAMKREDVSRPVSMADFQQVRGSHGPFAKTLQSASIGKKRLRVP